MPKHICEYCQGEFVKISNLSKHQRTAKYCVKLQEEKIERASVLTCDYCNKVLSRSDSLHRHYSSCIEYLFHQRAQVYQAEIKSLRERLVEKDQQLEQRNRQLWELTNTSINKTTNTYTHINQVTINEAQVDQLQSTVYPLSPQPPDKVTSLINKLHHQVMDVFPGLSHAGTSQPPLLLEPKVV